MIVFAADGSTSRDLTALVGVWRNPETGTKDIVYCRAWKPEKSELRQGKPTIDLTKTIGKEITRLWKMGVVESTYFDPYQLHSISVDLQKLGVNMIELPHWRYDQQLLDTGKRGAESLNIPPGPNSPVGII